MKNFYLLFLLSVLFSVSIQAGVTDDAGVVSIDSVRWRCAGPNQIYVQVKNFGTNTIDSVYIEWAVNGIPEAALNYQTAINPGDSVQVIMGSYTFTQGVILDFQAWTRDPNGIVDNDLSNDTTRVSGVITALNGSYTLGGSLPDFATFDDAVNALINGGICGAVDFTVRTGLYTEQVVIPAINGSSVLNTINFHSDLGDSASVVLTSPSIIALTDNYTLQLNGVDYITFMHMSFERSGTGTASTVVEITNESNDVSFFANRFIGPSGITSSNTDGSRSCIYSPLTYNNNNLVVQGNYFKDNACGIWVNGNASSHATGMLVEHNVFENYYVGAFLLYQSAPQVLNNTFLRNTTSATIDYYAISIRFTIGPLLVSKNKITGYTGNYGIRLRDCVGGAGGEGLVVNNFVQVGGTGISRGIASEENSGFQIIYNNSVHCTGTSATLGRAFFADGATTTNIQLMNNIFANTGGGYSFYVTDIAQSGIAQSNNNCLYSTGNTAYWTSPLLTIADFQTASGLDANSVSGDPLFTSVSDLHASAGLIADAAIPLALVQDDIDGDVRDAVTPDIGADEFMFVGISSVPKINSLLVYPNPATDHVRVIVPENVKTDGHLGIKDISGRTLLLQDFSLKRNDQSIDLDISSIPEGFYLIGFESNGESIFTSLVKASAKY